MVASMQGWGTPPRGWDRRRLRGAALELLAKSRLRVDELLTHEFRFDEAPNVYRSLAAGSDDVLRAVLRY
jgi:threonine dehydrogenase-like Zn-dependent dehydrogenase